jgi:hypothetical protein
MIVRRQSPRTRQWNEMDLNITPHQVDRYNAGMLIQDAFPNLTPAEREFIKTGYTQEDWDAIFPPEDEEPEIDDSVDASQEYPDDFFPREEFDRG